MTKVRVRVHPLYLFGSIPQVVGNVAGVGGGSLDVHLNKPNASQLTRGGPFKK